MSFPKTLIGMVVDKYGKYGWEVECKNAPSHLKHHFLASLQCRKVNMRLGIAVELVYASSPSSGLWYVTKEV